MEEQNSSQNTQDNSTSYTRSVLIVIVLVIIAGLGFYVYHKATKQTTPPSQQMQPTQTMKTQETTTPSAPTETGSTSGAMQNTKQKITVTASNFTFDPKTITVKKGQPVEITFKNSEGTHDLVIDEFHVKTQVIPGGQSETVTFTPDKAGTFTYYCSVANHRAMGMQGTITVE